MNLIKVKTFSFLALVLVLLTAQTQPAKLKKVKINKTITVSLPDEFEVMPDEGIAAKYPAARKPIAAFVSKNGQVDFVVSSKHSPFHKDGLDVMQKVYRASIMSMYTDVKFIRDEIKTINKQDYIVFEFTSEVRDESTSGRAPVRKYSIAQYTILKGELTIFTFHAPQMMMKQWQPIANEVMNSIKVK